jgi:hypothetical protein
MHVRAAAILHTANSAPWTRLLVGLKRGRETTLGLRKLKANRHMAEDFGLTFFVIVLLVGAIVVQLTRNVDLLQTNEAGDLATFTVATKHEVMFQTADIGIAADFHVAAPCGTTNQVFVLLAKRTGPDHSEHVIPEDVQRRQRHLSLNNSEVQFRLSRGAESACLCFE